MGLIPRIGGNQEYANLKNTSDSLFPETWQPIDVLIPAKDNERMYHTFTTEQVRQYFSAIVFTYDHKNYGRGKRGYMAQFTASERKTISSLYARGYAYEMRLGYPDKVVMKLATYHLLIRAGNFFNSI